MKITTKKLTIYEAYKVYILLKPVFPETNPTDSLLSFLLELVKNIRKKDDFILVEVASLFSELETDKIIEMKNEEKLLEIILDGFQENRIIDLMFFFGGIIK